MSFWTDERIELLREFAPHWSASKIAERIGCTRNAVIGNAGRLHIPLTKSVLLPAPAPTLAPVPPKIVIPPASPKPAPVPPPAPKPPPKIVCEPLEPTPKTIGEMGDCDCQWPLGDPLTESFHYCGGPRSRPSPYCESHRQLARGVKSSERSPRPILKRSKYACATFQTTGA